MILVLYEVKQGIYLTGKVSWVWVLFYKTLTKEEQ